MSIMFGMILLLSIYVLWKLFIDGWLFKIILFFAGWFGLYVFIRFYVEGGYQVAVTLGTEDPISLSWAAVVPTAICFLALLCTRVSND